MKAEARQLEVMTQHKPVLQQDVDVNVQKDAEYQACMCGVVSKLERQGPCILRDREMHYWGFRNLIVFESL